MKEPVPDATKEARGFFVAAILVSLDLYLLQPPVSIMLAVAILAFLASHLWISHRFHRSHRMQLWISVFIAVSLLQTSVLLAQFLHR